MFVPRPEPALCCSTVAPAPRSSAGLPGFPPRLRLCRCQAAPWVTPGWGSPDSRWPAACGAPPAPPWRAAARWWGCISHRCSPWSGSSACDLWATTARRDSGTAHTWGSSAAGLVAETPEPPCKGTGTHSHSFCQTRWTFQGAQVHQRWDRAGVLWSGSWIELYCHTLDRTRIRGVGLLWRIHLSPGWQHRYASDWHALMETSNQTMSLASRRLARCKKYPCEAEVGEEKKQKNLRGSDNPTHLC